MKQITGNFDKKENVYVLHHKDEGIDFKILFGERVYVIPNKAVMDSNPIEMEWIEEIDLKELNTRLEANGYPTFNLNEPTPYFLNKMGLMVIETPAFTLNETLAISPFGVIQTGLNTIFTSRIAFEECSKDEKIMSEKVLKSVSEALEQSEKGLKVLDEMQVLLKDLNEENKSKLLNLMLNQMNEKTVEQAVAATGSSSLFGKMKGKAQLAMMRQMLKVAFSRANADQIKQMIEGQLGTFEQANEIIDIMQRSKAVLTARVKELSQ